MISILTPTYNAARYLPEALDSVLLQDHTDWQLCVVDDGSTDDTWRILTDYARRDARIQPVRHARNRGILPALHTAVAQARGAHITRFDSDDLMVPHKLGAMYEALRDRGGVATGYIESFAHEGELGGGYTRYTRWINAQLRSGDPYRHIYKECPIQSSTWMMARETFDCIGGFEVAEYPEDYDLCFRMYAHRLPVAVVPDVIHRWRDRPERASRTLSQYADQTFFEIKVRYFVQLDYDPTRPLCLWGAGRKGKALARHLLDAGLPVQWYTDNERKVGHLIYGVRLQHYSALAASVEPYIIGAVSSPAVGEELMAFCAGHRLPEPHFWV